MSVHSPSVIPSNSWSASLLTPAGRGAVATIRLAKRSNRSNTSNQLSGEFTSTENSVEIGFDSLFHAANGISLTQQPLLKIAFGKWGRSDVEELVVIRTAPGVIEIHCHGGDAAVQRVLNDLSEANCDIIDWRSQVELTSSTFDAECLDVLSRTTTWRTTQIALEQANGLLRAAFKRLKELNAAGDEIALFLQLDELVRWGDFGPHLSKPWSVVLTGRPNVGKSSLINALLGYERAIVFDQPGTTRDVLTGETAFAGWPVVLADTAGIRNDAMELEAAGIALAQERLRTADLQVVLIDSSQPPTDVDDQLLNQWPHALVVAHKADLPDSWGGRMPKQAIRASSVSGFGIIELQKELVNQLVPETPHDETAIPLTNRQLDLLLEARHAPTKIARQEAVERLLS